METFQLLLKKFFFQDEVLHGKGSVWLHTVHGNNWLGWQNEDLPSFYMTQNIAHIKKVILAVQILLLSYGIPINAYTRNSFDVLTLLSVSQSPSFVKTDKSITEPEYTLIN